MLNAVLSQATRLAGRMHEALEANVEATSRVHEISEVDRQLFSFDVERWLTVMRGQTWSFLAGSTRQGLISTGCCRRHRP